MTITPRQRQVLALLAHGLSFADVGARLGISPQTAKNHASRAYARLGANNAAHAVAVAIAHGFLTVGESAAPHPIIPPQTEEA